VQDHEQESIKCLSSCVRAKISKLRYTLHILSVGQNHICTVYMRYFWQGIQQIYGHIRCMYTVLANTAHTVGKQQLL